MAESDAYLLGRGEREEARLIRQIADLSADSAAHLEKVGINPGERVIDLGCGPGGVLGLLAERVGPTGAVLGIERSAHFAELARRFVGAGRRTHRLFRAAGVTDIHVDAVVHVYPPGHSRRTILFDFINNVREQLLEGGIYHQQDLESDMAALEIYLANPENLVTSHLFYRLWGRLPG